MERNDIYRYEILSHLEETPAVTNRIMTAKLGCSVKLTHELLSDLIHRGYVHVRKHNSRRWDYLLTPSGIAEKARLTLDFLDFTFVFYREARKRSSQLCRDLAESGQRKAIFLGAGQLAEIAYLGVKEWGLALDGVYDECGGLFLGMDVKPLSQLPASKSKAIVVCVYDKRHPMAAGYLPEGVEPRSNMKWIFQAER